MPFLLVNTQGRTNEVSCVDVDSADAAFHMTRCLLSLGHSRIAFVHKPHEWRFAFVREGREGYERAPKVGSEYRAELSGISVNNLPGINPALSLALATFCAYDALALNSIVRLQERRIAVPADLPGVGFDNIPSISIGLPGLTSIRQPMAAIGETAAEMLQRLITERCMGKERFQVRRIGHEVLGFPSA